MKLSRPRQSAGGLFYAQEQHPATAPQPLPRASVSRSEPHYVLTLPLCRGRGLRGLCAACGAFLAACRAHLCPILPIGDYSP
jgi:hypothetical protein